MPKNGTYIFHRSVSCGIDQNKQVGQQLTDITDRLRQWGNRTTTQNHDDAIEAAREIERLRKHIDMRYCWYSLPDNPECTGDLEDVLDGAPHGSVNRLETHYSSGAVWGVAVWDDEVGSDHQEFATEAAADAFAATLSKPKE